jgi:hypothetical protein
VENIFYAEGVGFGQNTLGAVVLVVAVDIFKIDGFLTG